MSHVTGADDPGWPELLPPDRDAGSAVSAPAPTSAFAEQDDDLFAGWEPGRRVNRLTVVLAAGLLVVGGFAVGAVVAKRSSPASTPAAARFAATGGAAGRQGFGGFAGGGVAGVPGGASGGVSGGGASGTPVVVGTVTAVAANGITVRNFAGTSVVVHVPAGTPVTTAGLGGLRKGQTVSVEGTRASDGSVTATAVVSRS